jgi:hypothetical protein
VSKTLRLDLTLQVLENSAVLVAERITNQANDIDEFTNLSLEIAPNTQAQQIVLGGVEEASTLFLATDNEIDVQVNDVGPITVKRNLLLDSAVTSLFITNNSSSKTAKVNIIAVQ